MKHEPMPTHRVWTATAIINHGRMDGPKSNIPKNTGGVIASKEIEPLSQSFLYEIKWDTGQILKHYAQDFICIHPFQNLDEFSRSVSTCGKDATLELGPEGGFVSFKITVAHDGDEFQFHIDKAQGRHWRESIQSIIESSKVTVKEIRQAPKPRAKRNADL
jgi:hypothetical protein